MERGIFLYTYFFFTFVFLYGHIKPLVKSNSVWILYIDVQQLYLGVLAKLYMLAWSSLSQTIVKHFKDNVVQG